MKPRPSTPFVKIAALSVASAGFVGSGISAEVSWNAESGSLVNPSNWVGEVVPGTADTAVVSNGGTASLAGEQSATYSQIWVGQNGQGTATGHFQQTGGTLTLTGGVVVGRQGTASGTWTMTGGTLNTAELRLGAGGANATTPAGSAGTMTVSGANSVVNSNGYVGIGSTGNGVLTLSDSARWVHSGGSVFLVGGDNNNNPLNQVGGTGVVTVRSGASLSFTGAANLSLGRNTSSTATTGNGTLNVEGGTVTLGTGTVNLGSTQGGTQLGAAGTLNVRSGTLTTVNGIKLNEGTSTINFQGGVTTTGGIVKTMGKGVGTVNFDGGLIRAAASSGDFVTFSGATGTGVINLNVQAGGLKFDTNDFDVTISQTLSGSGGLTKSGAGTLTFSSLSGVGYTGDTAVLAGTLSLQAASLADTSSVWLSTGSLFDLAFADTDTVRLLFIDGVAQASGTWGAVGSGATFTSSLFSGPGVLFVAVPEPSHYAVAIGGLLAALVVLRRRAQA